LQERQGTTSFLSCLILQKKLESSQFDSLKNPMNVKRFLLTLALVLVSCLRTDAATVPVNDYSKQLVGAWAVRTYAYTFQPNGTYSYKPMEGADGMAAITGTWKIKGKKLTLTQSDPPDSQQCLTREG
jgi:hypothetical protein